MHVLLAALLAWTSWHASAIVQEHGYPVFTVDGKPFFVYGAAFFYERIPRERWDETLGAYQAMGINTIDLYVMWNWHQPSEALLPDFSGATDPRRDLLGLLQLIHKRGLKVILRPGPVIRNEWRNGGYPDWLLKRPQYGMPLHDILEGRYPATATLQNAHADAAAAEWLHNGVHLKYSAQWLRDVLTAVAPFSHDVVAIALDDDQGAYIDNDTYPAPHWHEYIDWLRSAVADVAGDRVPLFLNTFEMKVPSAAPAWSWGNWYQSDAYSIGAHDLAELDFATGLLQTQPRVPVMQAEFQAGWLQGADEGKPRPADPTNTSLALNELLRDGVHGVVNFPVQDTINPPGWEAPWANWHYFWDAALTDDLKRSPRYAPTAAFGADVRKYGPVLARTHPVFDAAIVWPPTLFVPGALSNAAFAAFRDATLAMQRDCRARNLSCGLVDLAGEDDAALAPYRYIVLPIVPTTSNVRTRAAAQILRLVRSHKIVPDLSHVKPLLDAPSTTVLLSDNGDFAFLDSVNPDSSPRTIGPLHVRLKSGVGIVPAFTVGARSARLVPVRVPSVKSVATTTVPDGALAHEGCIACDDLEKWSAGAATIRFGAQAGARIWSLTAKNDDLDNAASSIGLLRDAVDPEPSPSARDYIGQYTHLIATGTFNRSYECTHTDFSERCLYDAPDVPIGGALFVRTIRTGANGDIVIAERFSPHDSSSTARLKSVSGFAFADGDTVVRPAGANGIGILHGHRLATLRWLSGDVASAGVRQTRGAVIVTLVCARREVEFRLGIATVSSLAEAEAVFQANARHSP